MRGIFIGPFQTLYQPAWQCVEKACAKHWWNIDRIDQIAVSGAIPREVFHLIADCSFVVADLSGNRMNVFYELCLAHALSKPTIHIMEEHTPFAFYVSQQQVTLYVNSDQPDLVRTLDGQTLTEFIESAISYASQAYEVSNPILDAFETNELIKTQIPWLFGYRKTFLRERGARDVWIFHKTFYWEQSLSPYQEMITEGILAGQRKYQLLAPRKMHAHVKDHFKWLAKKAATDEQKKNLKESFDVRFDSSRVL